jgi:PhnB protein
MAFPTIYLLFPGTARGALAYYHSVFGGRLQLFTYEQFNRSDGPADAIAHGELTGPVTISAADDSDREPAMSGLMLTILGLEPDTQRKWFNALAADGRVIDELQERPWGDFDGQVLDRFGLHWLIGFKGNTGADDR